VDQRPLGASDVTVAQSSRLHLGLVGLAPWCRNPGKSGVLESDGWRLRGLAYLPLTILTESEGYRRHPRMRSYKTPVAQHQERRHV
jgi:hypothetical protein